MLPEGSKLMIYFYRCDRRSSTRGMKVVAICNIFSYGTGLINILCHFLKPETWEYIWSRFTFWRKHLCMVLWRSFISKLSLGRAGSYMIWYKTVKWCYLKKENICILIKTFNDDDKSALFRAMTLRRAGDRHYFNQWYPVQGFNRYALVIVSNLISNFGKHFVAMK